MDDFVIANAQVGYQYKGARLMVFVENLFDKRYFVYNDNDIAATVGAGRFVGGSVEMKF